MNTEENITVTEDIKEKGEIVYDCSRGCCVERTPNGALKVAYRSGCCKLSDFDWLEGIPHDTARDLYEVRFKNTRKIVFRNDSGQILKKGDLVVVEAATGHDVGIVTLCGPLVLHQLARHNIDPASYEFKKIYRKAKILDIERWQEAIARENAVMIRSRQLAARLGLDMKIGDVEFQGDGTKAIFYYIADARVDFRQLIKDFAEEFHIRVEMKQIGARQEAGLIGGIGVCGRALCCSGYMSEFQSITTQAARCQDLSLNPQKLAGQCSKLKCCINYEVSVHLDARKNLPQVREPLEFLDGQAFLVRTEVLRGIMYFSYDKNNLAKLWPLTAEQVIEIQQMNARGEKPESLQATNQIEETGFVSAVGDDSITRFDDKRGKRRKGRGDRRGGRQDDGAQRAERPRDGQRGARQREDGSKEDRPRGERQGDERQRDDRQRGRRNNFQRRDGRDGRENREPREGRENREPRDGRENREGREPRENREGRENREVRGGRDNRGPRQGREPRQERESHGGGDNGGQE